ncbi:unnamed protein product [Durusdinium trenchii]|uniref:Pseudouridine synthase RsuA/RluA-like domain-containing protein n=1 Tax=Durusdinium trenchii TaxID=1381693 RepID=A0ABP0L943_9DINO
MLRHVARRAHTAPTRDAPVSEWSDVVAAALGTTWACRFADMLRLPFLRALRATCARYGAHLDRRQPFLGYSRLPPTDGRAGVSVATDTPCVAERWSERMVLFKPSGWEVFGENFPNQLLTYVRRFADGPLARDPQHRFGFLHRLDVPTSGLILCASSYQAFFDLQLQLHAGEIERDYLLLCHGLCQRHHFDASLAWRGNEPTRAAGQGKPSKSWVKPMAQGFLKQEAMTMAAARIGTGRRHQLRSHFSFSGYPVVSDQFYTSEEVFQRDCTFSAKTFLHRVRLSFFAGTPSEGRREVLLAPPDLALLQQLNGKDEVSQRLLKDFAFDSDNAVQRADLKSWRVGQREEHERRGKGVIKTQLKAELSHVSVEPGALKRGGVTRRDNPEKAKGSHFDHASVEKASETCGCDIGKAEMADGLNESLNYDKVGELLLSSGPIGEVMKIFKTLEENASEDFRNEPLDKQLRVRVVRANESNGKRARVGRYGQVQAGDLWEVHGWWLRELFIITGLLSALAAVIYCSFAGPDEVPEAKVDDDEAVANKARTAAELYDQMRAEMASEETLRKRR